MHDIAFGHPRLLELLWLVVPLLLVLSYATRSGMSGPGRWIALLTRCASLCAVIVALAEPARLQQVARSSPSPIVMLLDRSQSVAGDSNLAEQRVNLAMSLSSSKRPMQSIDFSDALWSHDAPRREDQTDIQQALDQLSQMRSDWTGGDVVLFTDGRATRGAAADAARRLALLGAKVHVVPVGRRLYSPPRLLDVDPPIGARVGSPSTVRVSVKADIPEHCTTELLDKHGVLVATTTLDVNNATGILLRFVPNDSGEQRYTLQSRVNEQVTDSRPMLLNVQGPARILVADPFPDEIAALARSLQGLKMPVDVISPQQWPNDLSNYAAIVTSDFSGNELNLDQRMAVRSFVEQDGGGLIFIGGSNVLASRWSGNPLMQVLPITLEPPPATVTQKTADVSVCFVFDRSGSMHEVLPGSSGGVSKLELVKASIIAALHVLPEAATVTVIAFDTQPQTVVPPTPASQGELIGKLIDSVGIGGGTDVFPAVKAGLDTLQNLSGEKYFIVLTDGQTPKPPLGSSWADLTRQASAAGISWTSIAVGSDADQALLRELATNAHGTFAFCDTGDEIPRVFIQQAKTVHRVAESKQQPFKPHDGPDILDLSSLGNIDWPTLNGGNLAEAKPSARIELVGDNGHALLTSWQFGAGRVCAFCSDAKANWSTAWMQNATFASFWSTVVSSAAHARPSLQLSVHSTDLAKRRRYDFSAHEPDDTAADNLSSDITVRAISDSSSDAVPASQPLSPIVEWRSNGLGNYSATVDLPNDDRVYDLTITLHHDNHQPTVYHSTFRGSGNAELAETGIDVQSCDEIAFAGNGVASADISTVSTAILNRPEPPGVLVRQPLWPWLMVFAIVLWPIDVWVRKLL